MEISPRIYGAQNFFTYLNSFFFFQASVKIGVIQENKVHKPPGSQAFSTLPVWTERGGRTGVCYYLSKGSWVWQQPFNCVEAAADTLE